MKKIIFLILGVFLLKGEWQIVYQENFEQGLPQGWQVIDGNNDGYKWQVGNPGFYYPPPSYGTKYAYYNDDQAGPGSPPANEILISIAVFINPCDSIRFTYSYGFNTLYFDDILWIKMRKFKDSWSDYFKIDSIYNLGNGVRTISLSNYLPFDSIQFIFHYVDNGEQNYGPGVDNLRVEIKSVNVKEFAYNEEIEKNIQFIDITGRKINFLKKGELFFLKKDKKTMKILILK
ncbi:MAG: choice-of-anchor J domain-containing protein [candidate division WOR-3 bacterium]